MSIVDIKIIDCLWFLMGFFAHCVKLIFHLIFRRLFMKYVWEEWWKPLNDEVNIEVNSKLFINANIIDLFMD